MPLPERELYCCACGKFGHTDTSFKARTGERGGIRHYCSKECRNRDIEKLGEAPKAGMKRRYLLKDELDRRIGRS